MTFQTTIQKLAQMLNIEVQVASAPSARTAGLVKASTAEDAALFAQALTQSGVSAVHASRHGQHMVYVG